MIHRKAKPIKRSAIKKRKRPASETLRIYGPPARRRWMKTLPCSACGVVGYSEGAHVLGNGGMGRKADYDTQAPLCGARGALLFAWRSAPEGCHNLYDEHRSTFNAIYPNYNSEKAAAETQAAWLSFSGGSHKTGNSE